MTQAKPGIRLFIPSPLQSGGVIELGEKQAHYLAHVMRLDIGDTLLAFNGRDGEWLVRVQAIGKKKLTITLLKQTLPQRSGPDLWLVFTPIRNKTELVVEKAVELGVAKIIPVLTRHSVVKSVNLEKLAAHAVEASEQCARLDVPPIENCRDLHDILTKWPENRLLLYADESGGGAPIKQLLPGLARAPYAVLVGPEGGFSKEEQRLLASKAYVRAFTLGPRILRADTAAVAALACVQAWLGDWEEKPAFESA